MEKNKHVIVSKGNLIDIDSIDSSKKKTTIMYKMNYKIFVIGMLFLMIIVSFNKITRTIGYVFIAIACFVYFKTKDQKVMEIYDDSIVVYDTDEPNTVIFIDYDNLFSYSCNQYEKGFNTVTLRTNDGDVIYCETFETNKVNRALKKLIPNKEEHNQNLNNYQGKNIFKDLKNRIKDKDK